MTNLPLRELLVGRIASLGDDGAQSGIAKSPVDRPVVLTATGLIGDEQADRIHHGGPDKALHHYPIDHYASWREELGHIAALGSAGAFGENISTETLVECDVAVGDVFRLGKTVVEVSQARQPCWKLNRRFGVRDMARKVQQSGRTGWYYRVLQPGIVNPDDRLERIERRAPEWTLDRLHRALYGSERSRAEWAEMAALPPLAMGWRALAAARLEKGCVEDWSKRLEG